MSKVSEKKPETNTILLIEDDIYLSNILKDRLSLEGYEVFVCEGGEKGMEMMKATCYHFVLLDIILPDLDGMFILRTMRKDSKLKETAVMVLSNLKDSEYVEEAKSLGAEYFIKSEITIDEIIDRIQKRIITNNTLAP